MLLTRIPSLPNSPARLLTSPTTAGRTAFESTRSGMAWRTEVEVIVMKRPQRLRCMRDHLTGQMHGAQEVSSKRLLPVFQRDGKKILGRRSPCIGHADVYTAKAAGHGCHELADRIGVCNVNRLWEDVNFITAFYFVCGSQQRFLRARAHGDFGAF